MPSTTDSRKWIKFVKRHPLREVLKRTVRIEQMTEDDLKYAWAAYKKGWSFFQPGLNAQQFKEQLSAILSRMDQVYLLSALSINNALYPVGILVIVGGQRCEPHVEWFPWASKRNRLELLIRIARELRKTNKLMVYSTEADNLAFQIIRAYGLLQFGCKIKSFFPNGDLAVFYYSV